MCKIVCMHLHNLTVFLINIYNALLKEKMEGALSSEPVRCLVYNSGLYSSRARWPLAPNFCPQATRKSQIFHTNHMLGTLHFKVSEHWAPFNFP